MQSNMQTFFSSFFDFPHKADPAVSPENPVDFSRTARRNPSGIPHGNEKVSLPEAEPRHVCRGKILYPESCGPARLPAVLSRAECPEPQ
jgi:hypothetical protein